MEKTRIGVDVGGTFTDVVVVRDGEVTTAKVPTTTEQSEGVIAGIETACERAAIAPEEIDTFRHGTTVATNALLENSGAETALVTTAGFGDVLAIGRQNRPALYDLSAERPESLVPADRRIEIEERATVDGIEQPVTESALEAALARIADVDSIAISFLHAYEHPENEKRAAAFFRERTDAHVVASHEILAEFREYERTATTAVDAAVTPIIARYLDHLTTAARERDLPPIEIMQSNGGIADADRIREHAVTTALSGPAAGVVGASLFADEAGAITFDMGGTSSDVGLVRDGSGERTTTGAVGGHPVRVPMVDVETIGAGGGSIAWVDEGGALRVGPRSAGADPGPACYGRGGTAPTVTDANLLLGYLGEGTTLGEGLTLDRERAEDALEGLAESAGLSGPVAAARGVYRVANERMSRALRSVTIQQGHDPRAFGLVAFGGAGPMHAVPLADSLGVETISIPRANGVLSALGLLAAPERHDASKTMRLPISDTTPETIDAEYDRLVATLQETVREPAAATVTRQADLRYAGQSHELTVDVGESVDRDRLSKRFHAAHERTRGYRLPEEAIELVTLRVTVTVPATEPSIAHEGTTTEPRTDRPASFAGEFRETPVYDREQCAVGTRVDGPAIFEGGESTVVVLPDWHCRIDAAGTLVVTREVNDD